MMQDFINVLLIFFLTPLLCFASKPKPILLWHNLDKHQAKIFQGIVSSFNQTEGVLIHIETGFELQSSLLSALSENKSPEMVLAPSNYVGLASSLALSQVADTFIDPGTDTRAVALVLNAGKP